MHFFLHFLEVEIMFDEQLKYDGLAKLVSWDGLSFLNG